MVGMKFSYSKNEGGALSPPLLLMLVSLLYSAAPVSSSRGGVPYLPSIKNSRNAAKEAYATHLENELEVTRRQLYTSQNTCTTLRKRCEDQRMETLRLMASSAAATTLAEKDREENKEQLAHQEKEIVRLQRKLQQETQQYHEQVEKLTLLEAEMKELKKMKVQQNEAEVKKYEEKLEQSQQKQTEYEQEIQLLTLKLEAAQLAAQQQRDDEEDLSIVVRAQELQAQLRSVREKYSTVLNTAKARGYDDNYQKEIENEMDQSIQLALEQTLKAVEDEWETRYAEVETKLANMNDHVESLENERDSALRELEARIAASSAAKVNEEELKEELTLELTEKLTKELTDQLTEQLTDQLTEQLTAELKETMTKKIQKKYKKKYKQMQQEIEEQKSTSELLSAELNEEQRQKMEAEISAAKEQCELDYNVKLAELQKQSDERVQFEKERMRKLVRALLEREAKQRRETKGNASKKEAKKKKQKVVQSNEDNDADEMIQSAASLSSRSKKQSRKGVPRPSSF